MTSSILLCSIEGNIGAGKSTSLSYLRDKHGHTIMLEDISEWGFLLKKFYADPVKWSFVLQVAILDNMCRQVKALIQSSSTSKNPIVLMERSPASSYLFAYNSHVSGHMTRTQFQTYRVYFMERVRELPPIAHVYIKLSHPKCFERVKKRCRKGEKPITRSYLQKLEELHDKMFMGSSHTIICEGDTTVSEISDKILQCLR